MCEQTDKLFVLGSSPPNESRIQNYFTTDRDAETHSVGPDIISEMAHRNKVCREEPDGHAGLDRQADGQRGRRCVGPVVQSNHSRMLMSSTARSTAAPVEACVLVPGLCGGLTPWEGAAFMSDTNCAPGGISATPSA